MQPHCEASNNRPAGTSGCLLMFLNQKKVCDGYNYTIPSSIGKKLAVPEQKL